MNDHLVVHFVEARDRADFYAVGELTSVTFFGDDMGHGISMVKSCAKRLPLRVISDPSRVKFLLYHQC